MDTINGNILEIHYWFNDRSHSMDAFVENKCEFEILGIIKEIANIYSVEIKIETEPTAEGGLRKWLKVVSKDENKNASITIAIIVALITTILTTPIAKVSEKLIDKIFEDTEIQDLEKEKLRLEIEILKQEASKKGIPIESNTIIKKKKSNFYEALEKYPKVDKVSFFVVDEDKIKISKEKVVNKHEFKNFVLVSDDLDPIEIESAVIEIISPVLKKGKYKWMGYFSGEPISFNMQSKEFKILVQNGEVEFKNGSSINCLLRIRKKIDNEGLEKIVGYDVVMVNHYFENEKSIETKEGRKQRQIKENAKNQINLFDDENNLFNLG